jgi:hypothetical protein
MSDESEHIRKRVGRERDENRPLQRVWNLRERLRKLGVDLKANKDERIRKVVGRSERGAR